MILVFAERHTAVTSEALSTRVWTSFPRMLRSNARAEIDCKSDTTSLTAPPRHLQFPLLVQTISYHWKVRKLSKKRLCFAKKVPLTSQCCLNDRCDKPPPASVCRVLVDCPAEFRPTAHSWSGRQHYWASEPVPEKYAFQATNQQMEGHCRRVKPPRRGLYNREPYNHVNAGPWWSHRNSQTLYFLLERLKGIVTM